MHSATSKSASFKHPVSILEETGAWDSAPGPRESPSKLGKSANVLSSATFQQPSPNKPHCSASGDNQLPAAAALRITLNKEAIPFFFFLFNLAVKFLWPPTDNR